MVSFKQVLYKNVELAFYTRVLLATYSKNILEKCLRIDIALLKEFIDNKSITKIQYAPGQNQLANVLTKKGASSKELLNT